VKAIDTLEKISLFPDSEADRAHFTASRSNADQKERLELQWWEPAILIWPKSKETQVAYSMSLNAAVKITQTQCEGSLVALDFKRAQVTQLLVCMETLPLPPANQAGTSSGNEEKDLAEAMAIIADLVAKCQCPNIANRFLKQLLIFGGSRRSKGKKSKSEFVGILSKKGAAGIASIITAPGIGWHKVETQVLAIVAASTGKTLGFAVDLLVHKQKPTEDDKKVLAAFAVPATVRVALYRRLARQARELLSATGNYRPLALLILKGKKLMSTLTAKADLLPPPLLPTNSNATATPTATPTGRLNPSLAGTFFQLLKNWRDNMLHSLVCRRRGLFDEKLLLSIAQGFPTTLAELKSIEGMSKERMTSGGAVLEKVHIVAFRVVKFIRLVIANVTKGFLWGVDCVFIFFCSMYNAAINSHCYFPSAFNVSSL
jgi:hypothetical protein